MEKCDFKCNYLEPDTDNCEPLNGQCIGDMCECWNDCNSCKHQGTCQES